MKISRIISILLFFTSFCYGQTDQWANFFGKGPIISSALDGQYLWVGSRQYLTRLNTASGEKEIFTHWNSGLPANLPLYGTSDIFITAIAVDSQGNKWIGTYGCGLVKYDNSTFTVYNTSNSSLTNNNISSIAIDGKGNKWLGTSYGGVVKFNDTTFTSCGIYIPGLQVTGVPSIAIDRKSNIWAIIVDGDHNDLLMYNGSSWTKYDTSNSLLRGKTISSLAFDKHGNKWIGTDEGLFVYNDTTWNTYNTGNSKLPYKTVYSVAIDQNDSKWIGTKSGIVKFDGSTWETSTAPITESQYSRVFSIVVDKLGNKWTASNDESDYYLFKFDGKTWTEYNTSNTAMSFFSGRRSILSITQDQQGNRWFGTTNNGLVKYDGNTWTTYTPNNSGMPSYYCTSVNVDHQGIMWLGTLAGLVRYDGQSWTVYDTTNSDLPDNAVLSVETDLNGNTWVGTTNGVGKFDGQTWTVYNKSKIDLPENRVNVVKSDLQGNIWVGTNVNGLAKFDGMNWTVYNTTNSKLPDDNIYSIAIDHKGNKWFGTSSGLAIYDDKAWTFYNPSNSGSPVSSVMSIAIDEHDVKWIGTYLDGLIRYDGQTWKVYNCDNSKMPSRIVLSVGVDRQGNTWIGTDDGLAAFREEGVNLSTTGVKKDEIPQSPKEFAPMQNYPNPFNPSTKISFTLPKGGNVKLTVYDMLGKEVAALANGYRPSGTHTVQFDGSNLPSGMYIYSIQAGEFRASKKLLLIK
ncbi:MAG: T9SS type A sorting domain-containing protein [Ignavibacteria bacterium]|jgi:ligand-binding sensor domain-containing protein|nr:T9SS type A sorting domain-containing protein [Ignavibacteria bacterium]MCU7503027.1 T9SS type A sorting domain-containing protein [Ignavibacteria bacterium]MCU7516553.1 T9SS type A sorting domain-containing protein [Ignavibacteria bacterium]